MPKTLTAASPRTSRKGASTPPPPASNEPKQVGGKLGLIVALLRRPQGADISDMMEATGWQEHSIRGALAGALKRQRGFNIVSDKPDRSRAYRIPTSDSPATAEGASAGGAAPAPPKTVRKPAAPKAPIAAAKPKPAPAKTSRAARPASKAKAGPANPTAGRTKPARGKGRG